MCRLYQYTYPEQEKSYEKEETFQDALKAPWLSVTQWNPKLMRALDLLAPVLKMRLEVLPMKQLLAGGMPDSALTEIPHHLLQGLKLELGEGLGR